MAPTPELAIRIRGLRTGFGDQIIHDGLDLDVHRGEILGVVGGSGSGKSVLLRTIVGLNRPRAGAIEVLGMTWPAAATSWPWRRAGAFFFKMAPCLVR